MQSAHPASAWAARHETFPEGAEAWCARYWASQDAPHRTALLDALDRYVMPIATVLELGCHVGANLARLLRAYPTVTARGLDLNPVALAYGRARFVELGWAARVSLVQGDFTTALLRERPRSVDLVLSCYALAYVHPDEVKTVVGDALAITRRFLVIAEPMVLDATDTIGELPEQPAGTVEWRHDYVGTLAALGARVRVLSPCPPVDALNGIVIGEV